MGRRSRQSEENEPEIFDADYNGEGEYQPDPSIEPEQPPESAIVDIGDRDIVVKPMGDNISLTFDLDAEPIMVGIATHKYGIGLPIRKLSELIDHRVILYAARQFKSSFEGQGYAYYCIARDMDSQELFGTVIGSISIIELIESAALARFNHPIGFTIRYKDRGAGRSYYYYESV